MLTQKNFHNSVRLCDFNLQVINGRFLLFAVLHSCRQTVGYVAGPAIFVGSGCPWTIVIVVAIAAEEGSLGNVV